jgi:hypothetical protein
MADLYSFIGSYASDAIADINLNQAQAVYYNRAADNSYSMMEDYASSTTTSIISISAITLAILFPKESAPEREGKANQTLSVYDDMVVYARNYTIPIQPE